MPGPPRRLSPTTAPLHPPPRQLGPCPPAATAARGDRFPVTDSEAVMAPRRCEAAGGVRRYAVIALGHRHRAHRRRWAARGLRQLALRHCCHLRLHVMYDAFGVRLHAGKQAEILNQIVYKLPSEHPLAETRPLRELLGHTPTQILNQIVYKLPSEHPLAETRPLRELLGHTPTQVFAGGVLGFAVATFTGMIAGLGS